MWTTKKILVASKAESPLGSARAWSELGNRGLMNNVLNIGLQTRKKAGMTSSLLVCLSLVPQKGVSVPPRTPWGWPPLQQLSLPRNRLVSIKSFISLSSLLLWGWDNQDNFKNKSATLLFIQTFCLGKHFVTGCLSAPLSFSSDIADWFGS